MGSTYSITVPARTKANPCATINYQTKRVYGSGFTLVETLIAGLIIVMAMSAVARFSAAAMTASQKQELRREIEDEIVNNMERIQQKDSLLTWESIEAKNDADKACIFKAPSINGQNLPITGQGPAFYLKTKLEDSSGPYYVPPPKKLGANLEREIRPSSDSTNTMTALIIYKFTTPDFNQKEERRVLELNPNYAPRCFQL